LIQRVLSFALAGALVGPATVSAQEYIEIPGGGNWVTDVSSDGSVVVGLGPSPQGAFYWRWQEDPAPTYIGEDAYAISDDGTVIAGTMLDPVLGVDVAARWTEATGWQSIGYLPNALNCPSKSNAFDMSADGSTIVGLSWNGCSGRGFVWTEATGMQELEALQLTGNRASVISADGSQIAGFTKGAVTSRTPAFWDLDTSGSVLDPNFGGEVNGLSNDGSVSVGTLYFAGDDFFSAFMRTASGVIMKLGALNPGQMAGRAVDISEDGGTIAGYDYIGNSREAWVWTSDDGIVSMNDRLAALGVMDAKTMLTCEAMSDDGNVVVGTALITQGETVGYIATFSSTEDPWTDLGGGTPGIAGLPQLTGSGSLEGGTPVGLELVNAPASTPMLAWLSFASVPQSFFGGTVFATPFDAQFLFASDAAGEFSVGTVWPTGVPAGTEAWFQFIVSDPTVLWGLTLSNALKATAP